MQSAEEVSNRDVASAGMSKGIQHVQPAASDDNMPNGQSWHCLACGNANFSYKTRCSMRSCQAARGSTQRQCGGTRQERAECIQEHFIIDEYDLSARMRLTQHKTHAWVGVLGPVTTA